MSYHAKLTTKIQLKAATQEPSIMPVSSLIIMPYVYMKPQLDVPKSTEWQKTNQSQACTTRFVHYSDLFRGKLSINQAIFDNIYLRTEITGDLCGVFDKTDAQPWNESRMHFYYVTMQSICSHGDKSLVFVLRNVIG